jgi:hypothetical protein
MTRGLRVLTILMAAVAARPGLLQGATGVVINELMASNTKTLQDGTRGFNDWVELYNPSPQAVDVGGFFLTDDAADPTRWMLPKGQPSLTTLAARGYLLIWLDGNVTAPGLHAGFSLSSDGEQLALFGPDGSALDRLGFDRQFADVSYGRWPDGNDHWQYMGTATPGKANKQGYSGVVADARADPDRGFYDSPVAVTLSTDTEGAEIWYTLDANVPHQKVTSKGVTSYLGQKYMGPIQVARTTCIRAVAFKTDWKDSAVGSHTYLFLDDVIRQPAAPAGFPSRWRTRNADYAMDQRVVNDPAYSGEIRNDLKSAPSVCVVVPIADLFGSQGIYSNPSNAGVQWERAASMEWIDPCTGDEFGVNAGLRIQGGQYSRSSNPKKALRFLFKAQYGPSRLTFPLFLDTPVKSFNTLVLRSIWNFSWTGDTRVYGADYLRDLYARDTIRDMGQLTPHGRPVNVYINGLYWGLYIMSERPDESFAAAHLGGEDADYDVVKASNTSATIETVAGDPNQTAWKTLFAKADAGLASPQAYQAIQQYVDLSALIDYMLMIYHTGSRDAPILLGSTTQPRNFYALRCSNPAGPFVFLPWDVEWILEDPSINRVNMVGVLNPHYLMSKLAANPDFKVLVADHIYRRFFHDGALTRGSAAARYGARANEINGIIVGESARWGDVLRSVPYTRADWKAEVNRIINQFFSVRTDIVLGQLRASGWYPPIDPPVFQINGKDQAGGEVQPGEALTLVDPSSAGVIYYSTDGSDPRASAAVQNAAPSVTLVAEDAAKKMWVPTNDIGEAWRGGSEPFDDSAWTDGTYIPKRKGGVGFEMEAGYTAFISYDLFSAMFGTNASCYVRIPFSVSPEDRSVIRSLTMRVRCDDGFVAYLNGVEVAWINKPSPLAWDSACADRPDSTEFVDLPISEHLSALRPGDNLLAVQAMNQDAADLDLLFSAELIASTAATTDPEVSSSAVQYGGPLALKASTAIKARVRTKEWSALAEAIFAVGPVAEGLRVSELMYHPLDSGDPNSEFIELTNVGAQTINLNLVRFTKGIDFTFPSLDLAPGQFVLVVADVNAFESSYGRGLPVAGAYSGSLSNGGEHVQICDAIGRIIADFTYADNWYAATDGSGCSLTVKDVKADPAGLSQKEAWRPSAHVGGSPGRAGL